MGNSYCPRLERQAYYNHDRESMFLGVRKSGSLAASANKGCASGRFRDMGRIDKERAMVENITLTVKQIYLF